MTWQTAARWRRAAKRPVDAGDAGRLHAGLRQRLRDGGAAGRPADRAELAAARRLRALCRAALGLALHGAARRQRALLALPHPPLGEAHAAVQEDGAALLEDRAVPGRARSPDRAAALGAGADPEGAAHLPLGAAHHDHIGRRQHPGRHGRARLSRHPVDGERLLLQRRRRDADRAAAGLHPLLHRVRQDRGRARRDLRHPARRQVQGRAGRRPRARLRVRELRRQVHAARPRADRRQLPRQRARLQDAGGGLRGQGGALAADREVVRRLPRRRDRPLAARRRGLARQLRALQVQPAALLAGGRHRCSTTPTRRSTRC